MTKRRFTIERREFLKNLSGSTLLVPALRAAAAMGILSQSIACGGSSANAADDSNNNFPNNNNPTNNGTAARPEDWPAGVGNGKSVIVLGGGIAGMASAFEMRRLGYSVTILEASSAAGGRCRTVRSGDIVNETDSQQVCTFDNEPGLYFNPGPARIPHHHDLILSYCRQFNIPLEPFINDSQAAYFHNSSAYGGQAQVARRIIAETRGYIAELLAEAVQGGSLSVNLSSAEINSLLGLLQQYGELDGQLNYAAASRSGFVGQENANSRLRGQPPPQRSLNELLASNFWQFQLDFAQSLDQQTTMLQPVNGMDQIASGFANQFTNEIIYQARVTDITNNQSGVDVTYTDSFEDTQQISADYCVCALPATILRNIQNNFPGDYQSAISNFQYSQSVKVAMQSNRFWETDNSIYGGISWTDQSITQVWYPSQNFGSSNGVLVGAYTFGTSAGNFFTNLDPQSRLNQVTSQVQQLHPQINNQTLNGISVAWPKIPEQLGAWGVSSPGILTTPFENVYFAGEHLSILQGWQEGAVLSAYHAIDNIVQRDSAG